MRWAEGWLALGIAGCSGGSDTDEGASELPEIAGRYNLIFDGTNGCPDETNTSRSELIVPWAEGPLTITGAGTDLEFDFEEDVVFGGSVTSNYGVSFGGVLTFDTYTLDVGALGVLKSEEGRWVIEEGELEAAYSDGVSANDCTITGYFNAFQVG